MLRLLWERYCGLSSEVCTLRPAEGCDKAFSNDLMHRNSHGWIAIVRRAGSSHWRDKKALKIVAKTVPRAAEERDEAISGRSSLEDGPRGLDEEGCWLWLLA